MALTGEGLSLSLPRCDGQTLIIADAAQGWARAAPGALLAPLLETARGVYGNEAFAGVIGVGALVGAANLVEPALVERVLAERFNAKVSGRNVEAFRAGLALGAAAARRPASPPFEADM